MNNIKKILKEGQFTGKNIIVVDIQPEYESGFSFIEDFCYFINNNYYDNNVVILYNGEDTLDMISENNLMQYYLENGMEIETIENITFYDKGYAFFRNCMDEYGEETTLELLKFMYENDIRDSRDFNEDEKEKFEEEYNNPDALDFIEVDDMIYIPDLMDEIKKLGNNNLLMGGGFDECLAEVRIAFDVLDKPYEIYHEFTY